MTEPIGNLTIGALHTALGGLSDRQRTIADNIANVETPGYLAQRVDFESSLRAAIEDGTDPSAAQATTATSLEPTRLDGNNVNLDEETLSMNETQLRYQLVSEAVTDQFNRLRASIGGGS